VEVAVFFFVLSPLLLTAGWGVFHAMGGPAYQMRVSSDLADELTTARQAVAQLGERQAEAATIDPESSLYTELQKFIRAAFSLPTDPAELITRTQRVTELAIRKAREDADELDAAVRYAKESAKSAAEAMLADAVERAGKLHNIAKETNARKDALLSICRDVLQDHDPAWAEAWYAVVTANKDLRYAQVRFRQAAESLESEDEGVRAQAAEDQAQAEADRIAAETALADALAQQESLPPLPTDLKDLLSAAETVDRDATVVADEAGSLYEHIHSLTNATVAEMIDAAERGQDAQDLAVRQRVAAANTLTSSADHLREFATKLAESADEAEERCAVRFHLVRDSNTPEAEGYAWNLKRAQITAATVARRARRTVRICGVTTASFPVPGQTFGASVNMGLSEMPLAQVVSGRFPFLSLQGMFASLPWWMWIVQGMLYMLFVVAYWVPGDDESNRHEVRAMGLFLLALVLLSGVAYHQQIGAQIGAFVDLMAASS
jgi:hypothetical protein